MKTFEIIVSDKLSNPKERRYVVMDPVSKVIIDDAQGYGYKTRQNAYHCFLAKKRLQKNRKCKVTD